MQQALRLETGHTLACVVIRSLVASALCASVLGGCAAANTGEPEAQAVNQAQVIARGMSTTPVTFLTATAGAYAKMVSGPVNAGSDPAQPVWAVDFEGSFSLACGPQSATPQACPVNATVRVVLDEITGRVLLSETPAPNS
jgi:hypothetical protein